MWSDSVKKMCTQGEVRRGKVDVLYPVVELMGIMILSFFREEYNCGQAMDDFKACMMPPTQNVGGMFKRITTS